MPSAVRGGLRSTGFVNMSGRDPVPSTVSATKGESNLFPFCSWTFATSEFLGFHFVCGAGFTSRLSPPRYLPHLIPLPNSPSRMTGPCQLTQPTEWVYIAQGGANVLLSHNSELDAAPFPCSLLRVRKRVQHSSEQDEQLEREFGQKVIGRLLGQQFVVPLMSYPAEQDWLEGLSEWLSVSQAALEDRPQPIQLDTESQSVLVTDDLVQGRSTLAIEIKVRSLFPVQSEALLTRRPPRSPNGASSFEAHTTRQSPKSPRVGFANIAPLGAPFCRQLPLWRGTSPATARSTSSAPSRAGWRRLCERFGRRGRRAQDRRTT